MTALNKQARQVRRYTNYGVDMMEWDDGKYVKYSYYLALLDELEKEKGYASAFEAEKWHYHGLAESEGERADRAEKALKAAENNLIDSECHVAELEESLRDKQALLEAAEKRIAELRDWNAGLAQESFTHQQRVAELEVRTVKLPKLKMLSDYLAEVTEREREDILVGVKLEFHRVLAAAGIGVKGE